MIFVVYKINKEDLSSEFEEYDNFDDAYDTFCQWSFELSNDTGENPLIRTLENKIDKTVEFEEYKIILKMTNKN